MGLHKGYNASINLDDEKKEWKNLLEKQKKNTKLVSFDNKEQHPLFKKV